MSVNINGEKLTTFSDYINDEKRVSKAEKMEVEIEAALIFGKVYLTVSPPSTSSYKGSLIVNLRGKSIHCKGFAK